MRNRQHIQKLVLAGKLGDAIARVEELYPGLLHLHQDLHFKLKVRQFIEMVSGADSLDTETTMYGGRAADSSSEDMEETLDNEAHCGDHSANGNTSRNGNVEEESTPEAETPSESMEVDPAQRGTGTSILSNPARFEALIRFGRGLQQFSVQLEQEKGRNEANTTMLQEAFSLLAYADPWSSPVGSQLEPSGREPVCAALNSAILESKNLPGRPPLEISLAHSAHLLKLMSHSELGACAFADIQSIFN